MWTVLHKQYPNFEVLVHHQYFHGDHPVAVDLRDPGAIYLAVSRFAWISSCQTLSTRLKIQGVEICAEALRQIWHWLKQNQYMHRVDHNKVVVFLRSEQITDALQFLSGVQLLMNPNAITVRAVDDSVGIGEKKVSRRFRKFQYQVILKPGWYTRAEAEHWLHVVKTQDPDIYMTRGLKLNFQRCVTKNNTGCSVSSVYMFVKDQTMLTYLWLNFPAAIKKTYKLVHDV